MTTTPIDLTQLPAPAVVEVIDFSTLYAERKAAMIALFPPEQQAEIAATLELESEPLAVLLQENTYREMNLRQRVNDAARAIMLAYARGSDLDQLAAYFGIVRLVITEADPENDVDQVLESDTDLRKRVQLAPEGFSVAGPDGAYISATLKADSRVLDAAVQSPAPGQVLVTVLSRDGDGAAPQELLDKVAAALNAKDVRPITDEVLVQSAEILPYVVSATLYTFPGPDAAVVVAAARARLELYLEECHRIGRQVVRSGIDSALHVGGVQRVELADISITADRTQAPYCQAINLTYGGVHE